MTRNTRYDFSDVRGVSPDVLTTIRDAVASHLEGAPTVLAFDGAPGTGKTMIARRAPTVLPALDDHASAWITAEYEGLLGTYVEIAERPFRAPHHTISLDALVGDSVYFSRAKGNPCPTCAKVEARGGTPDPFHTLHVLPRGPVPRVGELGLARFGVLFLDELTEFSARSLEVLGHVWRSMSAGRPMIIASTMPCPCGWSGSTVRECACTDATKERYLIRNEKAFAALLGRKWEASLYVAPLAHVSLDTMRNGAPWPPSAEIAAAIGGAS